MFIEEIEYELAKIKEKLNQQPVMLHVDEAHLNLIVSIIKSITEFENGSVYLYGFRIQGKSVKYSDIDIALDYQGKPVPDSLRLNLLSLFEKSILPYAVDIIGLNSISPSFRTKIKSDFIRLI